MKQKNKNGNPVLGWLQMNLGPLLGLLALCVIVSLLSDKFVSKDNFLNILKSVSTNMMLACALTMVIILGLIDISVGSTVGLAGIVCATLIGTGRYPIWMVILFCLGIGLVVGLVNGILIAHIKIPAFIATLATQNIGRGLCQVICNGAPVRCSEETFTRLGTTTMSGGISITVIYSAFFVVLICILMYRTKIGTYLYAIGGNEMAAEYSGINVKLIKMIPYLIGGFFAAFCGVIWTARLGSGSPTLGQNSELDAIAATALGGASMSGGIGRIGGTMIGVLMIGVINNGLNLINLNSFYQLIVKGLVVAISVIIDVMRKNRAANKV